MNRFLSIATAAILALCLTPPPLTAADLATPTGEVILTITGDIAQTNQGEAAVFDLAMLEAFDATTIETTTIWTDGVRSFTGVPLSQLLQAVGAEGRAVKATAVNDYSVEIPADGWSDEAPIVAYLHNGEEMSLRDKGPLWVIYPYDSSPDYQSEVIFSRSIWQLDRIEVID